MRIRITCGSSTDRIPQIIHGMSANTMFWIIKSKKFFEAGGKVEQHEQFENASHFALPWDLDDFGRCVLAADFFGYTESDIQQGLLNLADLGLDNKGYKHFFENFLKMREEFKSANWDPVREFLDKINKLEDEANE